MTFVVLYFHQNNNNKCHWKNSICRKKTIAP